MNKRKLCVGSIRLRLTANLPLASTPIPQAGLYSNLIDNLVTRAYTRGQIDESFERKVV